MKSEQISELIKASNSTIQRLVNAIVGAMKINSQEIARPSVVPRSIYANQRQTVWWIHPTRQNIKNKHDACIGTSFGQCLETNRRASVHVWRKIDHVRPPHTTQCIPNELLLHTLNYIDVCAIERQPTGVFKFLAHKGNIKGLVWQTCWDFTFTILKFTSNHFWELENYSSIVTADLEFDNISYKSVDINQSSAEWLFEYSFEYSYWWPKAWFL
jgi:hypothetical protein